MPSTKTSRIRIRQKIGKYRIEKRISDGDFASVFRATDTVMGISVALKIVPKKNVNRRLLQTLKRESSAVAELDHAGIMQIRDANVVDGRLIIAMSPGLESLESRLTRRVSLETAFVVAEQILDASGFAHKRRVYHGSLSARNILLFADGSARLADYGVAAMTRQAEKLRQKKSTTGRGPARSQLQRSDVDELSYLMFHLFSGHEPPAPFCWTTDGLPRLKERVPEPMINWLHQALCAPPSRKFKDAAHMYRAFTTARTEAEKSLRRRARKLRFPATIPMSQSGNRRKRAA